MVKPQPKKPSTTTRNPRATKPPTNHHNGATTERPKETINKPTEPTMNFVFNVPASGATTYDEFQPMKHDLEHGNVEADASSSENAKKVLTPKARFIKVLKYATIPTVVVVGFIVAVILIPGDKDESYVHDFAVTNALVSPFDASSTHITAAWKITFNVTNLSPDHTIYYENASVSIVSSQHTLGSLWTTPLKPFQQRKSEHALIEATIGLSGANLTNTNTDILSSIASNFTSNQPIYFDLFVNGEITEDEIDRHLLKITCKGLKIEFPSGKDDGELSNKPIKCSSSRWKKPVDPEPTSSVYGSCYNHRYGYGYQPGFC